MATSKLLKPTNVTISIPEFTDQPDQRVNSNCLDKEADAINTLSEQIEYLDCSLSAISDCNSISATGIYKAVNSTLNTPITNNHYVIYHVQYSQSEAYQMAIALGVRLFIRTYQGTWSSWSEK